MNIIIVIIIFIFVDGIPVENADSSTENADSQTMFIGSTTITPIRQDAVAKFAVIEEEGGDADERDEADGTEEDVHLFFPLSEVCASMMGY